VWRTRLAGPRPALRAGLVLALAWLVTGTYVVAPDEEAVLFRLGRVSQPRVAPGLHWHLPWPVERAVRLRTRESRRLEVGFDPAAAAAGRPADERAAQVLTGDRNVVAVRVVAQYFVEEPAAYLTSAQDVTALVDGALRAATSATSVVRPVDDLLTTEKAAVEIDIRRRAQARIDGYGIGVRLLGVVLDSVAPPAEVVEAFRDVASAREDVDRKVREAQSYANERLPVARGEAAREREAGAAFRARTVESASGEASRFVSLAAQARRFPQQTRRRLYLETLERILPRVETTVLGPGQPLDLQLLRRP
jgi:membrane protease subunit HflK